MCALCTCAFWGHLVSLTAGWTWGLWWRGRLASVGLQDLATPLTPCVVSPACKHQSQGSTLLLSHKMKVQIKEVVLEQYFFTESTSLVFRRLKLVYDLSWDVRPGSSGEQGNCLVPGVGALSRSQYSCREPRTEEVHLQEDVPAVLTLNHEKNVAIWLGFCIQVENLSHGNFLICVLLLFHESVQRIVLGVTVIYWKTKLTS